MVTDDTQITYFYIYSKNSGSTYVIQAVYSQKNVVHLLDENFGHEIQLCNHLDIQLAIQRRYFHLELDLYQVQKLGNLVLLFSSRSRIVGLLTSLVASVLEMQATRQMAAAERNGRQKKVGSFLQRFHDHHLGRHSNTVISLVRVDEQNVVFGVKIYRIGRTGWLLLLGNKIVVALETQTVAGQETGDF